MSRYYKRAMKNWIEFRWWVWWRIEKTSQRLERWVRPPE